MRLALGMSEFSDENFRFAKQLGVDHVKIDASRLMGPSRRGPLGAEKLRALQDRIGSHGLRIAVVLLPQGRETQYWNARLGHSGRDQEIEDVCESIRMIGEAGIPVVEYTWSIVDVWGHMPGPNTWGRGGARVKRFDYDRVRDAQAPPGEEASAEEMWDRLFYFQERVIPAAEAAGVRLACHPHDPPTPTLRGEARILNSPEGLERLVTTIPSEVNGLNFCQGTVTEMGVDVIETIRHFGRMDKINHVHFRNVRGSAPKFDEVFVDDGDVDMLEAMRAYHEVGYQYALMPDHVPGIAGDTPWGHRARAHAIGYMRGLMQAVGATGSTIPAETD
ncbi:MAG: mannonate dehydratase [Armatimonadota bacterium]|jgi:mannonate dehydratase